MMLIVWKVNLQNCFFHHLHGIFGILIVVEFSWDVIKILKYGLATLHEENICGNLISQIIMYLPTV